jgi:UDP-N-acetylglucosamine/UDP-N-acetylgalactosamine diphosphorylase
MTSPQNHEETVRFFQANNCFGLDEDQLDFFQQGELPFLDQEGHPLMEDKNKPLLGPDGNGGALYHFAKSGIFGKWKSKGIRYVNFILVDNPLADPFDAELFGYQIRTKSDLAIKCIRREDPDEKVGVLAEREGKIIVVEYSEINETLRNNLQLYGLANLSLFCVRDDFIDACVKNHSTQELHKALKPAKSFSKEVMAWKSEYFIFDLFPLAKHPAALLYPRESCFAPLKNIDGEGSPSRVANALIRRDQEAMEAITGIKVTAFPLEISQQFYYPTEDLLKRWFGKSIDSSYNNKFIE